MVSTLNSNNRYTETQFRLTKSALKILLQFLMLVMRVYSFAIVCVMCFLQYVNGSVAIFKSNVTAVLGIV